MEDEDEDDDDEEDEDEDELTLEEEEELTGADEDVGVVVTVFGPPDDVVKMMVKPADEENTLTAADEDAGEAVTPAELFVDVVLNPFEPVEMVRLVVEDAAVDVPAEADAEAALLEPPRSQT